MAAAGGGVGEGALTAAVAAGDYAALVAFCEQRELQVRNVRVARDR
jgi:hypothetical protein